MVDDAAPGGAASPVLAADELGVELRPRPGGPARRVLRSVGAVVAGVFAGLLPAPSLSDLVVVRLRDGAELSRTPAGDADEADALLQHVRAAAQEQSVERFLQAWGPPATAR